MAFIPSSIPVIDFRRQSMVLEWNAMNGTWSPYNDPPGLVHGVALIRAAQPNICLFAREGCLHLQVGSEQYPLAENSPRIRWTRGAASLGLRRRFTLESDAGGAFFKHAYWTSQGDEFFSWLTARAADPAWRGTTANRWSEGLQPVVLRSS